MTEDLTPIEADRLLLLDRIATRIPWLDLDQQSIEWMTLDDGHEALLVNGGGIDGGDGSYFANAGDDVHAVGSTGAAGRWRVGCIVIRPDGSRYLARSEPDPLSAAEAGLAKRVLRAPAGGS